MEIWSKTFLASKHSAKADGLFLKQRIVFLAIGFEMASVDEKYMPVPRPVGTKLPVVTDVDWSYSAFCEIRIK